MPVKFILDELQKKQEKTINEILTIIKKQPYPDRQTAILGKFTESLFKSAPTLKIKKKIEKKEVTKPKEEVKKEEKVVVEKPLPPPPKPTNQTEETAEELVEEKRIPEFKPNYVLKVFDTPINVSITTDPKTKKMKYEIIGPTIDLKLLTAIKEEVKKKFEKKPEIIGDAEYLKKTVKSVCKKLKTTFSEDMVGKVKFFLHRDLVGFKKLDALLRDPNITSVFCEGIKKPIMIEYAGIQGRTETNIVFEDNKEIAELVERIAKKTSNVISADKPILNTVYAGVQIQAIMGVGGVSSKLILKKRE